MQRILHISGKMDRAGAETMVMNLYRAINRKAFQFDFVVFSDKPGDFDSEIKSLGGKIYIIQEQNPIARMFALKNLLIDHPEYKIVHGHTLLSNVFHMWAAKEGGIKHRISHAHSTSDKARNGVVSKSYQLISKWGINRFATEYISCGQDAASFLFPYQKDVLLLPNAVDAVKLSRIGENQKEYIKEKFGFSGFKIVQIGRLQDVKNHSFTIHLAEFMKQKGLDFKVYFIGQGPLEKEIRAEIAEKNLEDVIEMLGLRTDIPELMAGADAMLMPSLHEGFPVVLVESQAVGLPALISDTISAEVDLGLDLVKFLPLDAELEIWASTLMKIKNKTEDAEQRLDTIKKGGFDIAENVKKLEDIYRNMA
ncbi:glycosyltransferase [Aequorivita capsosiphonis]|uniref:glycosyltransferase n=1 Tax=Aequorivita capsosiphonis TaxID=487317 RepID=UPI0003F8B494|nr:glycosyltransferase [Aequorivita capsosiphonis]